MSYRCLISQLKVSEAAAVDTWGSVAVTHLALPFSCPGLLLHLSTMLLIPEAAQRVSCLAMLLLECCTVCCVLTTVEQILPVDLPFCLDLWIWHSLSPIGFYTSKILSDSLFRGIWRSLSKSLGESLLSLHHLDSAPLPSNFYATLLWRFSAKFCPTL